MQRQHARTAFFLRSGRCTFPFISLFLDLQRHDRSVHLPCERRSLLHQHRRQSLRRGVRRSRRPGHPHPAFPRPNPLPPRASLDFISLAGREGASGALRRGDLDALAAPEVERPADSERRNGRFAHRPAAHLHPAQILPRRCLLAVCRRLHGR